MYLTCKICSFQIEAESEKEAYIKGCKRMAKYVASKKYKLISSKIDRIPGRANAFEFTLLSNIDLGSDMREFCKMCKEFHCSFYINEDYNCSRCNLKSFMEREQQKARVSKNYYKQEIQRK